MTSARIWTGGRGQSGARRRIDWRWLLGLALLSVASGCAGPRYAAGLRPLPLSTVVTAYPDTPEVHSLQPTLRWEAFPRPEDLKVDKAGVLAAARNVTYELRIWRAEPECSRACFPGELVYARSGLTATVHTVETPFALDTLYLWTIRARFELNGEPRVTEWGVQINWALDGREWNGRETEIPPHGYYRFKTPKR